MHIFCCGRSTIIESQVVRRKHARSPYGTRTCPVRERLEDYVLCGAAAIRKLLKAAGPVRATARTAGCKTSLNGDYNHGIHI